MLLAGRSHYRAPPPSAKYEQSLRTLTYFNRNAETSESSRLLQIQGLSDEIASNIATRAIQIINNIPRDRLRCQYCSAFRVAGYVYRSVVSGAVYQSRQPPVDRWFHLPTGHLPSPQWHAAATNTPVTQSDIDAGLIIRQKTFPCYPTLAIRAIWAKTSGRGMPSTGLSLPRIRPW